MCSISYDLMRPCVRCCVFIYAILQDLVFGLSPVRTVIFCVMFRNECVAMLCVVCYCVALCTDPYVRVIVCLYVRLIVSFRYLVLPVLYCWLVATQSCFLISLNLRAHQLYADCFSTLFRYARRLDARDC